MIRRYARHFDQIAAIVADSEQFFAEKGIDPSLRTKVDLALAELFVNMVTYNTESDEDVQIEMKPIDRGIEVSLTDRGVDRFDPTLAREVDVPVMLIHGENDRRFPVAFARRLVTCFRPGQARLYVAAGAGHSNSSSAPDYPDAVRAFLDRHADRLKTMPGETGT